MKTTKELFIKGEIKHPSNPVEEALKESEVQYRRIFETAQHGVLIVDADTENIVDVNPFLINLLGYSREKFIGKALWNFGIFDDIKENKSAFNSLLSKGTIRYEHLPLKAGDGRCIEVEIIGNVYRAGDRRKIQYNIHDNSKRKCEDKALTNPEWQRIQDQKIVAIVKLADDIAKQFNHSHNVIKTGLDLLKVNGLHQEIDAYLQKMKSTTDRMSSMTWELLTYVRKNKFKIKTISISELVSDSIPLIESIMKPQASIETDMPYGLPNINANREQIQIVLLAILANASEAINSKGAIKIILRKEKVGFDERTIAFPGLVPGIYVSMIVEDTGRGMNEKAIKQVFEPFYSTKEKCRGLGMALAYNIVINHGGWISIESEVDIGTTVKVWLPAFFHAVKIASKNSLVRSSEHNHKLSLKEKNIKGTNSILPCAI